MLTKKKRLPSKGKRKGWKPLSTQEPIVLSLDILQQVKVGREHQAGKVVQNPKKLLID